MKQIIKFLSLITNSIFQLVICIPKGQIDKLNTKWDVVSDPPVMWKFQPIFADPSRLNYNYVCENVSYIG